jgi:hypothetical protein
VAQPDIHDATMQVLHHKKNLVCGPVGTFATVGADCQLLLLLLLPASLARHCGYALLLWHAGVCVPCTKVPPAAGRAALLSGIGNPFFAVSILK